MTQINPRVLLVLFAGMLIAGICAPAARPTVVDPPWPTCSGLTCPGGICAYVFETPDCPPKYALVTPIHMIQFWRNVADVQTCLLSCDGAFYFNMENPGVGCSALAPYDFYRPSKDPATGKTRRACVDPIEEWCLFIEPTEINPHDPCCYDEWIAWFCWDCFEECE